MQCRAYSKKSKKQCQKSSIKGSVYCLLHQEKLPLLIGFVVGIIASLIVGYFFYWLSDKKADVSAFCYSSSDDYCAMECTVENNGRNKAEDTILTFLYLLPKDTVLSADQGYGISLNKYENIPNPYISEGVRDGAVSDQYNVGIIGNYKTFNIKIPNIPAKKSVEFTVYTNDKKNQAACGYLNQLMDAQQEVIKHIGLQFKNNNLDAFSDWVIDDFISAKKKRANLYRPGYIYSENKTEKITFLNEVENKAFDMVAEQELGKMLSLGCDDSMNGVITNNLPVFSVESFEGDSLLTIWPSYVCFGLDLYKTKIFDLTILKALYEGKQVFVRDSTRFNLQVIQPENYEYE